MSIHQLNFDGKNKVEVAIMRLQEFEPPEGYYLAFSGGKDSIVIYDLALKASVEFDAHYNVTGIDPPELVYFMRQHYPEVKADKPKRTIWQMFPEYGYPRRQVRWCCEVLKEHEGDGRMVITGVRWAESVRRLKRQMLEVCRDKTRTLLHPIIDWEDEEVWEYIRELRLDYCQLYDKGFTRLGCVLCPMTSQQQTKRDLARWPRIAELWKRAGIRYFETTPHPGVKQFSDGEAYFNWWISRRSNKSDDAQCVMFQ